MTKFQMYVEVRRVMGEGSFLGCLRKDFPGLGRIIIIKNLSGEMDKISGKVGFSGKPEVQFSYLKLERSSKHSDSFKGTV